jgi:hypothetical protein
MKTSCTEEVEKPKGKVHREIALCLRLRHGTSKCDEGVARRDPGRSITLKLIVGGQESAPAGLLMGQGRSIVVKACLHFASREVAH